MNTADKVLHIYNLDVDDQPFDHVGTATDLVGIVQMCLSRKDYKSAAKHAFALGFLGIELEYLGLSDVQLNSLLPYLSE